MITLLDAAGKPALRWTIDGARPSTLAHGALDAENGDLLSETVELAFDRIDVSA